MRNIDKNTAEKNKEKKIKKLEKRMLITTKKVNKDVLLKKITVNPSEIKNRMKRLDVVARKKD
jgi:hypothetical protein